MVQGETDTSYEVWVSAACLYFLTHKQSLLQLAERLQPVSRGASTSQIEELPTRIFTEGSMPASEASYVALRPLTLADAQPLEQY